MLLAFLGFLSDVVSESTSQHLEELDDPRSGINQRHQFMSAVGICLMAVVAGARGPTAITAWDNDTKDFLHTLFPLPNGTFTYRLQRDCQVSVCGKA